MRTKLRKRASGIMIFGLILTAVGGPGYAQQAAEEEQPAVAEEATELPVVVGEITVTSRKVEEDIQDVPISITTLQGEDLDVITTGGLDIRALSGRVPSLIMESSFGRAFPRFYIRGLGNPDFDLNASQPVSMVVDEVVMENPIVKGMPLFDIQQVEVARGPQGTLFGRNTPAGIVKFDTVKPSQDFDAYAKLSYGTYGTTDIQAAVGGSLGGNWSGRFSALYQSRSDWVDNEYEPGPERSLGGYDTTAFRGQLLWEPTDDFSALINLHGWDVDGTARIFRANIIEAGTNNLVDDFRQDVVYHDGKNKQEISSFGGVLKLEYDFGAATLTSVTGYESIDDMYSRGDIDAGYGAVYAPPYGPGFIPFVSESADGIPYLDQWTQEIRIASNGGETWDWLVGAFYFNEELQADTFSYDSLSPGNPQDGYAYQTQDATSYALFGSVNWYLTDVWTLTGGVRYSNDDKDFLAERPDGTFQPPTTAPITEHVEDSNVSWDLSTVYNVSDTFNIYGRVATGYRAPSIQGRILFCADFEGGQNPDTNCVTTADTETILSVEAGIKTILAQNRVRFNLTGYVYQVDGQQVTAVGGVTNTAMLLNVDKTKGHGLETDIQWTPTGNWLMSFGASWNPTEFDDPNLRIAPCGGGCTVTDPIDDDGFVILDGNSLPHSPDVIFNGIINWRSDPAYKRFFATFDWTYYSEKNFFLYESKEFKDDGFEVGLRAGYAFGPQGQYEVALFGRNITDEIIVRGGIDFDNLTGFTNDPRIVGVEFLASF
ncbi:MAG: TonB-dependent receptor [Acidobacteria bacterium]|nr:TonB-dependent receptor [Acidobacteriota bacterium]